MRPLLAGCICALIFATACSPAAPERVTQEQPAKRSQAILLLENPSLQPGAQTNVGIQFQTENGWHLYWQNPGDSGEPPRIQWRLPPGVTAGALEWPAPKRLYTTAGTDYGYEGTVVLLSTVRVSPSAQPGTTMEVAGNLRWLVCRDICVPQRTELRTSIQIADRASVNNSAYALLHAAAERIPRPLPQGFHARVINSRDTLQLVLLSHEPIARGEFFPSEPEQIDDSAPQELVNRAGVTRLTIRKSDQLQRDPERLRGVILLNGLDAYQLDLPIGSSSGHERR